MRHNYSNARNASWHIIEKYNIDSLPVDVVRLAQDMGIKVMPYSKAKWLMLFMGIRHLCRKNDGLYVRFLTNRYILYNDDLTSDGRIRFTIAHEIGHHVLLHTGKGFSLCPRCAERSKSGYTNAREKEANIFASRLLAPSIVLHEIGVSSPKDIMELCGMSREAAEYRYNRLVKLNERNSYLVSPLEKKALEKFERFIKENRITK